MSASLRPARSLRLRIVVWITLVVTAALFSVIFMTRSVMFSQINSNANAAVEQEIDEFHRFATEGIDPETQEPFTSARRLIETYMSRQYPDDDELLVGLAENNLIQFDYSSVSGRFPPTLRPGTPLAREIFRSPQSSGIYDDPQLGDVHWGRVPIDSDQEAYFAVAYHTAEDRAQVNEQIRIITLMGLGGLVASTVIAYIISGQILAPLRHLRRVAAEIANKDLTQRVPEDGNDELAHLAHEFNRMLDRLETAYHEQRTFVDDAGHELRTPITVVRGQLELLESTDAEGRRRSIELATNELDRMSRMVNDMLTLAVADSGDFVDLADVDVAELMIDIEDKALTLSDRAQLVEVAEGTVALDENRVTEAILELFGNALRYSDGEVAIGSSYHGEGAERVLRLWVRDRGRGISAENQASLFDRFTRGEQSGNARPTGAGLGLSIVQAIGRAHGGRAYVDSTVGLGSVFGLEIPAPAKHHGEAENS
ncbi:two-component sensor histidine kinase [Corynebacterium yudongzhengii]|uniref:histidine kinase n=1 Tax=Corynebacterium yudongzhengii TaxID=2080740 RepID=A0A2U1T8W3_9CORY|nr:HAMP domain-containing sensor histidine kinase [Corynebacterium yudongzhengii]AWB82515.1 two-component sensor histidine kinase [Corynebacterium yudongzhengii]PWC02429.1 sensor histidine kinase [Corynebacterium yudongzhengii]